MSAALEVPAGDTPGLAKWLRSNDAAWLLDDAVLGCLLDYTVSELLEDHGIADTRDSRRWFSREIDAVLSEGC